MIATPHDTHAALAARALAAGRHVWCEKPLALTEDELDAVEKAWRESGAPARDRLQPPLVPGRVAAQRDVAGITGPKLVVYRVAAGPVPTGTGITTAGRAGACSARYAISSTRRRRWSASRSRT